MPYPKKGVIAPGSDADLVLLDPNLEKTLSVKDSLNQVDWYPYEGMKVKGIPVLTMLRGKVIAENGRFLGQRFMGKFLKRQLDPNILRYPCV